MVEEANMMISFAKLGMDKSFIVQAEKLGLYNLGDLMKVNVNHLKKHKDFSFLWYAEMLSLLKEHDLIHQFQQKAIDDDQL